MKCKTAELSVKTTLSFEVRAIEIGTNKHRRVDHWQMGYYGRISDTELRIADPRRLAYETEQGLRQLLTAPLERIVNPAEKLTLHEAYTKLLERAGKELREGDSITLNPSAGEEQTLQRAQYLFRDAKCYFGNVTHAMIVSNSVAEHCLSRWVDDHPAIENLGVSVALFTRELQLSAIAWSNSEQTVQWFIGRAGNVLVHAMHCLRCGETFFPADSAKLWREMRAHECAGLVLNG